MSYVTLSTSVSKHLRYVSAYTQIQACTHERKFRVGGTHIDVTTLERISYVSPLLHVCMDFQRMWARLRRQQTSRRRNVGTTHLDCTTLWQIAATFSKLTIWHTSFVHPWSKLVHPWSKRTPADPRLLSWDPDKLIFLCKIKWICWLQLLSKSSPTILNTFEYLMTLQ